MDSCTTEQEATLTPDGDVELNPDSQPQVVYSEGDPQVWCSDCNERLVAGKDGLSSYWEVL